MTDNKVTTFATYSKEFGIVWKRPLVVLAYVSISLLPIILIVAVVMDLDEWQQKKLCERQASCIEASPELRTKCETMYSHVQTLFISYTIVVACQASKVCLVLSFLVSWNSSHRHVLQLLDCSSIQRIVVQAALEVLVIVLEIPTVFLSGYRLIFIPLATEAYSQDLYPLAADQESITVLVFLVVSVSLNVAAPAILHAFHFHVFFKNVEILKGIF